MNKVFSVNEMKEQTDRMTDLNDITAQPTEIIKLYEETQMFNKKDPIISLRSAEFPSGDTLKQNEMCFYKLTKLTFDNEYPRREAFENVLQTLGDIDYNFVYVLTGTKASIEMHIGVVKNGNNTASVLSANNYGEIIKSVFEGNFGGSELVRLKGDNLKDFALNSNHKYNAAGVITGIPSINEEAKNDNTDFQGIDRLINSMIGLEWRIVVVCEPISREDINLIKNDIYNLYNKLSYLSKKNVQTSKNNSVAMTKGKSDSDTKGKNKNYSESDATNSGKSSGDQKNSTSSGKSNTKTNSKGISESRTESSNESVSMNMGTNLAITREIANKHAAEMMKYIDEELLERMKNGTGKGLYDTSVYYMAENPAQANRLKSAITSLFQGDKSSFSPLFAREFDLNRTGKNILNMYQNRKEIWLNQEREDIPLLFGRRYKDGSLGLSTILTAKEVGLLAGLPQKEVPGISLCESVEFGLNENHIESGSEKDKIDMGELMQRGRRLSNLHFYINKSNLSKHTFIAGVTGSGKTTTCHKLLSETNIPFLVIEPAKTEYRALIDSDKFKNVVVFTLGNELVAPFRINPFEVEEGEMISSHIDMIKATFTSAFPMEASMPQLLEESIYSCYQEKGWDVNTGEWLGKENREEYPIMSELLAEMRKVVEKKGFGKRLEDEYIGSLVSRLSNLTIGSKGNMLNCRRSIKFNELIDKNIVIEMEDLKSAEDKSLFMGFILSKLSAVIKARHRKDPAYKHLTLIEEAHRLLSKVEYGDPGSKKTAVETFTDLLAEVRKYGEGLIIVDQIPNKLASEVLKNTNTKIIHRILAKDDKETVGDTMLMNDKQKEYLSALSVGEAVIFTENTDKPVHVHVNAVSNTNAEDISEDEVRKRYCKIFPEYNRDVMIQKNMDIFKELLTGIYRTNVSNILSAKFSKRLSEMAASLDKSEKECVKYMAERLMDISGTTLKTSEEKCREYSEKISSYICKLHSKNFENIQRDRSFDIFYRSVDK